MLHAQQIDLCSPVGQLSTAELLNPDPRWVRLEMLRLLNEFGQSLYPSANLQPAFVTFADVLLLSLAASYSTAPQASEHLPKIVLRMSSLPDLARAVADAMPKEVVARAFADRCSIIIVDAARHLELVDLALSMPLLRMTAYVGALRYLADDPDLRPRHLLRFHDTMMRSLTDADLTQALQALRRLTEDVTTSADGPLMFQPDYFSETNVATNAPSIVRPVSDSGEFNAATIRRLTASLKRLQARQEVLLQTSEIASSEAIEISDQIGFLFRSIAFLERDAGSARESLV